MGDALFCISYGLYLLTTRTAERDNGCIINTAMQVSDNPNQVLVAVNTSHLTAEMLQKSGQLNLSVLSTAADFPLYQHYGFQSGRKVDKFADATHLQRSKNGLWYLTRGTNAFLSAEVEQMWDIGSHILFLATVGERAVLNGEESATYAYYRERVKPAPEKTGAKGFACRVCGYRYPGETLPPDFVCPICGHGVADFEPIS